MPPTKVWLNLHYGLGGDVVWRISRWPPWRPTWILEWNKFSSSESLCLTNAFSLIWLNVREQMFQDFQDGHMVAVLDILERNKFSNSKSSCHPNASYQVWAQSGLPFGSRRGLEIFKMATVAATLDIGTAWFLKFWISMCSDVSNQVSAQSDIQFVRLFEDFQDGWHGYQNSDLSNSKSPCGPNVSHQIWAQSDRVREQIWFQDYQDYQDGRPGGHLG